ncbi:TPA: colicin-like pore-forming protein [Klebsiella oxytoca]|uniref:colicin-like pore-forming protein n=1 Tax=Klebsiella oxytoca TaxID=571 RepID=UPI002DB7C9F5|nr:colicin-like pore-forming protein [Klebsiella oxytoca]MEB7876040.1 colicin-like pore-forming protein [Klebsiella oxytoca]
MPEENMTVTHDVSGNKISGGGVHWGGGGNTGNHDSSSGSSSTQSPSQTQAGNIINNPTLRKKFEDFVKKAKLINPKAKLTLNKIEVNGDLSIGIENMTKAEVSQLGVGFVGVPTNTGYTAAVTVKTGYKIPSYPRDYTNLNADNAKLSAVGVYISVLQGMLPPGYKIEGGKVTTEVTKKDIMTAGGKGGGVRVVTLRYRIAIPVLTDAWKKSEALKKEIKEKEAQAVKDAVKFTADFYTQVSKSYGAKAEQLAKSMASQVKGKKIRNVDDALRAYDKHKANINKKINAKDRAAITNALKAADMNTVAKNIAKFSKGVGYVGPAMDSIDAFNELKKAVETDNWRPFFVKVQTIAIGLAATHLAALAFAAVLSGPVGVLGYGLIMAGIGAIVNDTIVEEANKIIGI